MVVVLSLNGVIGNFLILRTASDNMNELLNIKQRHFFTVYNMRFILICKKIAGIASLFAREEKASRIASLVVCVIGVLYLIVGTFVMNPVFLAG